MSLLRLKKPAPAAVMHSPRQPRRKRRRKRPRPEEKEEPADGGHVDLTLEPEEEVIADGDVDDVISADDDDNVVVKGHRTVRNQLQFKVSWPDSLALRGSYDVKEVVKILKKGVAKSKPPTDLTSSVGPHMGAVEQPGDHPRVGVHGGQGSPKCR